MSVPLLLTTDYTDDTDILPSPIRAIRVIRGSTLRGPVFTLLLTTDCTDDTDLFPFPIRAIRVIRGSTLSGLFYGGSPFLPLLGLKMLKSEMFTLPSPFRSACIGQARVLPF
jgi:hypothetical protein